MKSTTYILSKYFLRIYAWIIIYSSLSDQRKNGKLRMQSVDSNIDGEYNIAEVERTFNESLIYRVEPRIYLDVGIIVDKDLYESLKNHFRDVDWFFKDLVFEISNILSWHRMEFSVKSLDIAVIDKNIFDLHAEGHEKAKEKWQNRVVKDPLDFYIMYYNSSLKLFHTEHIEFFRCKANSILLQNILFMGDLNEKRIAEQTTRDFITHPSIIYDTESDCKCPYKNSEFCIHPFNNEHLNVKDERITKMFTKCEINTIYSIALDNTCLFEKDSRPHLYKHCGDGIVDENEECDCGPQFVCKMTKQDKCCYFDTCRFKDRSYQCSDGLCCEDCLFKRRSVCRKNDNECDPDEYCDGTSQYCPEDKIYEQYTMCNTGIGMCINGMCSNFNSLCKYAYKNDKVYFDYSCYDKMLSKFKTGCESKAIDFSFNHICNRLEKCNNFICASDEYQRFKGHFVINFVGKYCIMPTEKMLRGWFKHSANYLKCGDNYDQYCYNSTCSNDEKYVKNCKNGICKDIDNSIQYEMKKNYLDFRINLSIKTEESVIFRYNYAIYLNTVKKEVLAMEANLYLISAICVIITIFILSLAVYFSRNRRLFKYQLKLVSTMPVKKSVLRASDYNYSL